jgi:LysR family transcriptional regulator, transcriptional activator of nhaA
VHKLNRVIAEGPISPTLNVRAYNHPLGESGISFFAARSGARKYLKNFPLSLDGAPMLMPTVSSTLRRMLEHWFETMDISPVIIAEFDDRALMKAFGEANAGIFTSPTAVEDDVIAKYGVNVIGRTSDISESYYAISAERRIKHPAVSLITEAARSALFTTT